MLPEVMEFKIKGKQGEHEVASLLSDFANIMTPEQDVGIDFLCELYRDRTNRVLTGEYFCVQAKATEKIADVWKANIDKKTIVFWLNQTYPVFLLLFEKSSQKFFWLSVERNRKEWSEKLSDIYQSVQIAINKETLFKNMPKTGVSLSK